MMISLDRLVFEPKISLVSATQFYPDGLDEAIEISQAEEAAETHGTPLNELTARVWGRYDTHSFGGAGDDIPEFAGRQCYRSWGMGRPNAEYIDNVIGEGHGSIFQHAQMGFQIVGVSRALSHELVRHGTGTGVSQESQRYVDAKDVRFVVPPITVQHVEGMTPEELDADPELSLFRTGCQIALDNYIAYQATINERLKALYDAGDYKGWTAYKKRANEAARALLPNAAETRLFFSMNLRSARYILSLRGTEYADLEIRRLAVALLDRARFYAPNFFAGLVEGTGDDELPVINAKNGRI